MSSMGVLIVFSATCHCVVCRKERARGHFPAIHDSDSKWW